MSSYFEPDSITPTQATNINTAASDVRSGTTSVPIARPDMVAVGIAGPVGGAANVYGAWVTLVAANILTAHMLTGLALQINGAGDWGVFDIGVGAAGVEVVIGSYPFISATALPTIGVTFSVVPALFIPANARTAVRLVENLGATAGRVLAQWTPRPLA